MFSRALTSIAAVVFSVGVLLYGMGTSYSPHDDGMKTIGLVLLVGGLVGTAIGIFLYRADEAKLVADARSRYGPDE